MQHILTDECDHLAYATPIMCEMPCKGFRVTPLLPPRDFEDSCSFTQGFRATPFLPRRDVERLLFFHAGISSDSSSAKPHDYDLNSTRPRASTGIDLCRKRLRLNQSMIKSAPRGRIDRSCPIRMRKSVKLKPHHELFLVEQ